MHFHLQDTVRNSDIRATIRYTMHLVRRENSCPLVVHASQDTIDLHGHCTFAIHEPQLAKSHRPNDLISEARY